MRFITKLSVGFTIAGIALLLPAATSVDQALTLEDDATVALSPIVRISLDSLHSGEAMRFFYRVPTSPQWNRIRHTAMFGDHGYIVLAVQNDRQLIPVSSLKLDVSVFSPSGSIRLEQSERAPYGYSQTGADSGLRFRAQPAEELQIGLRARDADHLPPGDLRIEPYFDYERTDLGDQRGIEELVRPWLTGATYFGLALLVAGAS